VVVRTSRKLGVSLSRNAGWMATLKGVTRGPFATEEAAIMARLLLKDADRNGELAPNTAKIREILRRRPELAGKVDKERLPENHREIELKSTEKPRKPPGWADPVAAKAAEDALKKAMSK